jgi:hypothetical protein
MKKRNILAENKLQRIITETVKRVLNETKYTKGMIFVSYLKDEYIQKAFKPIQYDGTASILNKCRNGLWASPIDSIYGWKQWCEEEEFPLGNNLFTFKLKDNAKIYVIDNYEDLEKISTMKDKFGMRYINFKQLLDNNYDGIYASENAVVTLRYIDNDNIQDLSSWDVESLCVFNPNAIILLGQEKVEQEINQKQNQWDDDDIYDEDYSTEKYNSDVDKAWTEYEKLK